MGHRHGEGGAGVNQELASAMSNMSHELFLFRRQLEAGSEVNVQLCEILGELKAINEKLAKLLERDA